MELPLLAQAAALGLLISCGDTRAFDCGREWAKSEDPCNCCYASQIFAARDSLDTAVDAEQIHEYFNRWRAAVEAEPILVGRVPQTYRNSPPVNIQARTTNPQVIAAWMSGTVETGVPALDSVTRSVGVYAIGPQFGNPGGAGSYWYFSLQEKDVYNEEALNSAINSSDVWLPDATQAPRDDGTWSWSGGDKLTTDAQIDFTFGWGDCFVGCDGFHSLRAVVSPSYAAKVYDLGGDPLPSYLQLSPETQPWKQ